jgi:hypothetical protein
MSPATAVEDERSITLHQKAMQVELRKSVPADSLIDDRMVRTQDARRQDIPNKPLLEILDAYPALRLDSQVKIM